MKLEHRFNIFESWYKQQPGAQAMGFLSSTQIGSLALAASVCLSGDFRLR
jgi:hypothetical protein